MNGLIIYAAVTRDQVRRLHGRNNTAGDIVATNKAWAQIEKHYLTNGSDICHMQLTDVGAERAQQLPETHVFSQQKRKSSAPATQLNKVSHSLFLQTGSIRESYTKHLFLLFKAKAKRINSDSDPSTSERPTKRIRKIRLTGSQISLPINIPGRILSNKNSPSWKILFDK